MPSTSAARVDVARAIDEGPVSGFQILAIALCSLVALLDGLDSMSIAIGAPAIVEQLKLPRSSLGPIFSAALFGAMIGALVFGPLGDRFGRKRILILAASLFGLFTIATAYVSSFETLLAARFVAGLGLGGATPCFIALASEYAPSRRRAMTTSLIWSAFPFGGVIGGFLNAYLLNHFGWRSIFLVGGVAPLVVAAVLFVALPESIRFLIASGGDPRRVAAILARIRSDIPAGASFFVDEPPARGVPLGQLFANGRAPSTLLLWAPFFTAFGVLGLVVVWTPALLRAHGVPLATSSIAIALNSLGSLVGMSTAGWLIDRFGAGRVLIPALLLGAVATGSLGYAAESPQVMEAVLVVAGFSVGMGASGSIALAALTYPTAIRSSGVGWAMGMGRFGQVLAPLFAGAVTSAGWSGADLFLAVGLAPLAGAAAIFLLRRRLAMEAGLRAAAARMTALQA